MITRAIERRLSLPCTPSELAAILGKPVRTVRATLYNLRKQGRAMRLDTSVKTTPGAGRREYFWMTP